jgi:hypothetical protein
MKETGKRPSALQHPLFQHLGIDFIHGDENFDINDPDTLVGTLWYDFLYFIKNIINN